MASSGRCIGTVQSLLWSRSLCKSSLVHDGALLACRRVRYPGGARISPWGAPSCRSFRSSSAHFGVHRHPQLTTVEGAREFLSSLPPSQRSNLNTALQGITVSEEEREIDEPSWKQLRLCKTNTMMHSRHDPIPVPMCYQNTLPFIGFGFLDNFIMITVADGIEETVGVIFCISTMAAAGFGNMVSDLAGLGLADQVDALCRALGIPDPKLTPAQMRHRASRWMGLLGRCAGIIIGCLIGMFPLLWIRPREPQSPPHSVTTEESKS